MEVELPPSPLGSGAVCCMCGDRGLPHELLRCKLCRVRLQHRYCSDLYPRATAYRRCNWCLSEQAQGGGVQGLARAVASKATDKRKAAESTDASTTEEEGERRQNSEAATRSRRPAAEVGQPLKKHRADERGALPPSPGAAKGYNVNKKQKADERAELPPSPGATAKGNNGNKKQKDDERAALPPSPGAAKGTNVNKKQKDDERAALPPSPGAAKGINVNKKQKYDERAALPPSPGATAKGNNGNKKPMQAGKLARPGRVKVRRYKLLAEVISC
ncbi:unnamed protein product [Alopecurus aequalis]